MRRLTDPQRRALFAAGAYGKSRAVGGRRVLQRTLRTLDKYVDHATSLARSYDLTEAGRGLFAELFGDPCREHGWQVVIYPYDRDYRRCESCRAAFERVEGHEPPPRVLACDAEDET